MDADAELEELAALAAVAFGAPHAALPDRQRIPGPRDALVPHEAELAIAPAPLPPPNVLVQGERFAQRSSLLMQHARAAKRAKRAEEGRQVAEAEAARANAALRTLANVPSVAQMMGQRAGRVFDEGKARVYERLACGPRETGRARATVLAQARACAVLADAGVKAQALMVNGTVASSLTDTWSVASLAVQWDESTQRFQGLLNLPWAQLRGTTAQTATSVMVMSGHAQRRTAGGDRVLRIPWFGRPLRLDRCGANELLEGLARGMPGFVESELVTTAAANNATLILHWACDRAASNLKLLAYVFDHVKHRLPANVLPFVELCGCHGVAIAKTRSYRKMELASAAFSLTRMMRIGRQLAGLRDAIISRVERELVVHHEPRPAELRRTGEDLVDMLYSSSGFGEDYLWKVAEDGTKRPTQFLQDLQAFLAVVDFDPEDKVLRHWCHLDDDDIGGGPGLPCCRSRQESIEKVAVPIINLLTCHGWNAAQSGRWIHVTEVLKRLALLVVGKDLLSRCLSDLRAAGAQAQTTAAQLARMIEEDPDDHSAKTQLRLLRCIRAFSAPQVKRDMAVVLVAGKPVEQLLYNFLGYNKQRPGLLEMLDPHGSPLVTAQGQLLALAENFSAEAGGPWSLLKLVGADLSATEVRRCVQQELLKLSAGLLEVFELRWSKPPYRWVPSS